MGGRCPKTGGGGEVEMNLWHFLGGGTAHRSFRFEIIGSKHPPKIGELEPPSSPFFYTYS